MICLILLLLDNEGICYKHIRISAEPPVLVDGRVPKKHKRDFESIADYRQGKETHLLIFGSGSKLPQRSFVVVVKAVWLDGLKSYKEYNAEILSTFASRCAKIIEENN
jgi:hypothetical protein